MKNLSNGILEIEVSETGAELQSLKKVSSNREYLWNGDPKYWDKHAPILFPSIGRTHEMQAIYKGQVYPMPKHGFAQNLHYICQESDRLLELEATDNEETRKYFPYAFRLKISYQLSRNKLIQKFTVTNTGTETMPYHVGGHPAFHLPHYHEADEIHGYLSFNIEEKLVSHYITPQGHYDTQTFDVVLNDEGLLPLKNDTFNCDTILDTRGLISRTCILDKNKKPFITVKSDAPVMAYWAPCSPVLAPFVCVEPWFGCCEGVEETGEKASHRFINLLSPGETKEHQIEIIIE